MPARAVAVIAVVAAFFVVPTAAFATSDEEAGVRTAPSQVAEEGADFTQKLAITNNGPDIGSFHVHFEVEPLPWSSITIGGTGGTFPASSVHQDPASHTFDVDANDVPPGDDVTFTVTVTPSHPVVETATMTASAQSPPDPVASNDSASARTTIAGITVSGGSFADQVLGTTSAPQQVTVTNNSAQQVTLTGAAGAGDAGDFAFGGFGGCANTPLASGAGCSFDTTFAPTATGLRSATVTLTPNSGPVDPATFVVAGHGTAPPPPAATPDTTPPIVTLTGLPHTVKLRTLERKGLRYRESANEACAFQNTLVGRARKVTLGRHVTTARALDVTLAQSALPLGAGSRNVHLRPSRRLIGNAKRFGVRVQVVGTDASGNRSLVTKTIKVR